MSGARDTNNIPRDVRVDTYGRQLMRPVDAGGADLVTPSNTSTAALVTLAAAAVSGVSADQTNPLSRGLQLNINITSITGTAPTLTVTIQGKDPVSGVYYPLLTSAALAAAGLTSLTLYPGATVAAMVAASQVLPLTWRISYAIAGTTPAVSATIAANMQI